MLAIDVMQIANVVDFARLHHSRELSRFALAGMTSHMDRIEVMSKGITRMLQRRGGKFIHFTTSVYYI
jgi:hypothetical protein